MKRIAIACLLIFSISACNNDDDNPVPIIEPEYVVFGEFASGMNAEDSQMFKVTLTTFEKEVVSGVFTRLDYEFEADETMSQGDFSNARQIIDWIPQVLIESETDTYGCPDCHDQGGYFLEFGDGNHSKKFIIDPVDTEDQPQELINFKNGMATLLLLFDN